MNKLILKSILADQILGLLQEGDPIIPRTQSLKPHLKEKEITIITGVRRCGKSSLIREFAKTLPDAKKIIYLNFDDPRLVDFKSPDFEHLYDIWLEADPHSGKKVAIFDEIQNIQGWERWMNFFSEQKNFKVYITGSNSKLLSSELATHLTGRHRDIVLYPLSFKEILLHGNPEIAKQAADPKQTLASKPKAVLKNIFNQYFKYGGFPRVWQSQDRALLGEYYNDILYRDIVRRYRLRQSQLIASFGASMMSDLGRKINKTKMAKTLGIKEANTINKYLGFFSECYLGQEIRKFDTSIRKQMRSLSKFYAIDPVLAQRIGIHTESKNAFYLENFVFAELLRDQAKIYYWQEDDSSEIDFVVETQDGKRHLVQVAWNIDNQVTLDRELRGFEHFKNRFPKIKIHQKLIITVDENLRAELPPDVTTVTFQRWALNH